MSPTDWVLSGDTGESSMTLFAVMTGSTYRRPSVPQDNDDFGRCYRLLRLFPEWRDRLHEVAMKHAAWRPLVAGWDELTTLYEACCGPDGRYSRQDYEAHKVEAKCFYDRLSVLNDEGRIADGWVRTSPICWTKKP